MTACLPSRNRPRSWYIRSLRLIVAPKMMEKLAEVRLRDFLD